MERIAWSYLAGAATVTAAVVLSGAHAAIFFALGFVAAVAFGVLIGRLMGARRIARLFAPEVSARPARAARLEAASARQVRKVRPVTDENLFARYQRMPKREKMKLEMDAWNEAFEKDAAEPAAIAPEVEKILAADNVADDVVSALVNLKVPSKRAHEAVNEAQKTSAPEFEPLFQAALSIARKVA
jgi:hypothetical protein